MTRCDRCNQAPARKAIHPRHRSLCDFCAAIIGITFNDQVRAGVDFLLASDPRGSSMDRIVEVLRGEAR